MVFLFLSKRFLPLVCVCEFLLVLLLCLFYIRGSFDERPPPPLTREHTSSHHCRVGFVGACLKLAQDFDPQRFESLKWMLANTGMRDMGFDFEDVGMPDKVQQLSCTRHSTDTVVVAHPRPCYPVRIIKTCHEDDASSNRTIQGKGLKQLSNADPAQVSVRTLFPKFAFRYIPAEVVK